MTNRRGFLKSLATGLMALSVAALPTFGSALGPASSPDTTEAKKKRRRKRKRGPGKKKQKKGGASPE
ncbi:MAG: hypothetical protein ABI353_13440 [Isosphaeraceae bacterium]